MSQFILKDRSLLAAAAADIDNRAAANEARQAFAQRVGAEGFKVVMATQNQAGDTKSLDAQAVTLLKFSDRAPQGFVTVGQDKDGKPLAVPDVRTDRGVALAKEMATLPGYTQELSRAMGFGPKVEGGKVSFGITNVEEIGRDVVVKTSREPKAGLDLEAITPAIYSEMKAGVDRAAKMVRDSAPNPYAK